MSSDLLKYLSSKVQEDIKALSDDLSLGKAKDHGEYKFYCGIVRGLMMANSLFEETARKMEHDED
jgi:hypothetical protein